MASSTVVDFGQPIGGGADEAFQRRSAFLGLFVVAVTCSVHLLTLLRPVLEPLLWAVFLVTALHPLVMTFESMLLRVARLLCGCRHAVSSRRAKRSERARLGVPVAVKAGAGGNAGGAAAAVGAAVAIGTETPGDAAAAALLAQDAESPWQACQEAPVPPVDLAGAGGGAERGALGCEMWSYSAFGDDDLDREEGHAHGHAGCCANLARAVAVACALGVVMGIVSFIITMICDALYLLKSNFAVYEKGAHMAVAQSNHVFMQFFGTMPPSVVEMFWENVVSWSKSTVSDLLSGLLTHTGKIVFELSMLALYVMFWLCTPMPLNSRTERIFRRYLLVKGVVCMCYGVCVWVMLYSLAIDIALLFGLLSFFLSFIPEVGAFIAMLLPVPVILFDSRLEAPLLTLVTASIGQLCLKFIFANIVEVLLVGHDVTMRMHPVITLIAVAFFGFIWGPTGMLLSVPLVAYVKVVILSDLVPAEYRDPILVALEGDGRAPQRHARNRASSGGCGTSSP